MLASDPVLCYIYAVTARRTRRTAVSKANAPALQACLSLLLILAPAAVAVPPMPAEWYELLELPLPRESGTVVLPDGADTPEVPSPLASGTAIVRGGEGRGGYSAGAVVSQRLQEFNWAWPPSAFLTRRVHSP